MARSFRSGTSVALAVAIAIAGCEVTQVAPESDDAGADEPGVDARDGGGDARAGGAAGAAPMDAGTGWVPDFLLSGSVCALEVGARCDGREDCGQGEVCCGIYDPLRFAYRQIACVDRCDGSTQIELCHPGDACSEPNHVCRRSYLLTFDFVGVCAEPSQSVPAELTGEAVPGEIACGADRCIVGSEQCCLRTRYDFEARALRDLEPFCAPLDHDCDCDDQVRPNDGGVADEDAGAP